ncbi:hypothetical protein [Bradyrhizobium sp. Leo170]|uniref:hypothetical protein n=1 Tax=Bradyrhizobium sp. Leo170 TaxID=1571199 RepID=UPI00102E3F21|nr:hypothetical protein [Bradyrhizobium sp. Leo170]TAI67663.1 hypothetical protein CWO89_01290 [Bradyrhizobium sp. Leo170]
MNEVAADEDKAWRGEAENWRGVLRDTLTIALELDGVPGKKVEIAEDERASLQWAARNLHAIEELESIINSLPHQHDRAHAFRCLCSAIGAAFVIGSHASVSETQRVFQHKAAQGKAGAAPRAIPWHGAARELAIKVRATNPRISKTRMSEIISDKVPDAPSPRQVRDFLTTLEKEGK